MFTIIGSGFGLYGYLPALVEELGMTVLLPAVYEKEIRRRSELAGALHKIYWVDNEKSAISLASAVVIASTPKRQFDIVSSCVGYPSIKKILLEKPVAVSPSLANLLLEKIDKTNKQYRIGYTFLHTTWFDNLIWPKSSDTFPTEITITWTFMAHHFLHNRLNWKRLHNEGGGVLRFYGIHLVALLAYYGYENVLSAEVDGENQNEPSCWKALFSGEGLPNCYVRVDSRCVTKSFEIIHIISGQEHVMIKMQEPFQQEKYKSKQDCRVGVLRKLIDSFDKSDKDFVLYYKRVINLWKEIEENFTLV